MEGGSQGVVLVYTLGLEQGGEEGVFVSVEVPYVRVSVRPREGSRLPLPPTPLRILFWLQSGSGSD